MSFFSWNRSYSTFYFFVSSFVLVVLLYMYSTFDLSDFSFRFYTIIYVFNTYILLGLDMVSFFFILLTSIILPLCILFNLNNNIPVSDKKIFFFLFIVIEFLLIEVFLVLDLVFFYILFEFLLIPFYVVIVLNNIHIKLKNKKEVNRKINAFLLLFFYTIVSSFLMLISIVLLFFATGTTSMPLLIFCSLTAELEDFLWLCVFTSFSIKVPILPLHLWLPEAHVESPTEASVILAAVILKIGAYGILRILLPIFPFSSLYYSNVVWVLGICTIVYSGMNALIQIDLKRIIAYASIAHMNIGVLGMFSFDLDSICGSFLLMIGHGFVSGGLFFVIGLLYNRLRNKNINYMNGFIHFLPALSLLFFILILGNNALPGTINFIGEFIIINAGFKRDIYFFFISIGIGIFVTTIYSFLLCNKILYGLPSLINFSKYTKDLSIVECCLLIPLFIWIIFLGIFPDFLFELLKNDVAYLLPWYAF